MGRLQIIGYDDLFDKEHNIKDEITTIQFTNNHVTVRFNRVNLGNGKISRLWNRDSLTHETGSHRTNNMPQAESKILDLMATIKGKTRIMQKLKGVVIIW